TILPTARTSLSMAVYKALPARFARIHPRFLTPTWSTIVMGAVSVGFYVVMTVISQDLLTAMIGSIGLIIAFYYGLTGFACVWFFRRTIFRSFGNFIQRGLFPFVGGAALLFAFVYGAITYGAADYQTDSNGHDLAVDFFGWVVGADAVIGVGGILVGLVLMFIWWAIKPDFFRGRTLQRMSADLVLVADGGPRVAAVGLPDSGFQATLVAPDRSNLPEGETVVLADDPEEPAPPASGR
ncbi:hypothetical protein, partial [Mesorhizobium japonicum]|uniref:hypothetical protein n=1 Tax=Mesorhizobium japonicum TaxID=2066070 RepID=UPI003B592DF9